MKMLRLHLVAYVKVDMPGMVANALHAQVKKPKRGLVMDMVYAGVLRNCLGTEIVRVILVGKELHVIYPYAHKIAIQEGNVSSVSVYAKGAGLVSHAIN